MPNSVKMDDFNAEKYTKTYCSKNKCNTCDGSDQSGEPNGYGCVGLEKRQETMYKSILHRRLKKQKKLDLITA